MLQNNKILVFEGGEDSVDNLIKKEPNLFRQNFKLMKQFFSEMYSALMYLRLKNIWHKDFKLSNIVYTFN
jgi:DNA phosphorothioation-dependent restriction protein DptG